MSAATTASTQYLVGAVIQQQSRRGVRTYVLAATRPHVNRHGRGTVILEWVGKCTTCGCPFVATSGRTLGYLNRNCPMHVQRRCGGAA